MPLTFPVSKNFNESEQNLKKFIDFDKNSKNLLSELTTGTVMKSLDEMKKAQLGFGHYVKKIVSSTLVYGGIMTLPPALVGVIGYWKRELFQSFLNQTKDIDVSKVLQGEVPPLVIGGATVGSILVADYAIGKLLGFRPATWVAVTAFSIWHKFADNAQKEVLSSYKKAEIKFQATLDTNKAIIKNQMIGTFKGMANALEDRFINSKNEPAKIKELKIQLIKLKDNLPTIIKTVYSKLPLSAGEMEEIVFPLETIQEQIENVCLPMKEGSSTEDSKFNLALLLESDVRELPRSAFSPDALSLMERAQQHRLGWSDTVAKISGTLGWGLSTLFAEGAIAGGAYLADAEIAKNLYKNVYTDITAQQMSPQVLAVATGAAALAIAGSYIGHRRYAKQHSEEQKLFNTDINAATQKVRQSYDGIAQALENSYDKAERAKNLAPKIKKVDAMLARYGVTANVTEKLNKVIEENLPKKK